MLAVLIAHQHLGIDTGRIGPVCLFGRENNFQLLDRLGRNVQNKSQFIRFTVTIQIIQLGRYFLRSVPDCCRTHTKRRTHIAQAKHYRFILLAGFPFIRDFHSTNQFFRQYFILKACDKKSSHTKHDQWLCGFLIKIHGTIHYIFIGLTKCKNTKDIRKDMLKKT